MASIKSRIEGFGYRRLAMTVIIIALLAFYLLVMGFWRIQLVVVTAWVGGVGIAPEAFTFLPHRLHDIAFMMMFWPFIVGLLVQLRKPTKRVAAQLMALVTFVGGGSAMLITGFTDPIMMVVILGVPTLIATLLHPASRELISSLDRSRINRVTLALVVVASVPLLGYAATQTGLQSGAIERAHDHDHGVGGYTAEEIHEQHLEFGHYMAMVGFSLVLILLGLITSLSQPGWWIPGSLAGVMALIFGLSAIAAPSAASNPGTMWGAAAALWGLAFIGAVWYTREGDAPSPYGEGTVSATD